MSWKMIGKPTVVTVDHALAARYKAMEPCHGDRKLKPERMRYLSTALHDGTFRTCSWASAICKADGKEYRINGKHTSNAMAEMNGTLPRVDVTIERYECDTLEDIADLYATFDTRASARSNNDVVKAYTSSVDEFCIKNVVTAGLIASGIAIGLSRFSNVSRFTAEQRARLLMKHVDFAKWFIDTIGDRKSANRFLHRRPIIAAMFETYQRSIGEATAFWSAVKLGTDTLANSPSRVLERFLRDSVVSANNGREIYVKCLHAWNAKRRGAAAIDSLKYYASADIPKVL